MNAVLPHKELVALTSSSSANTRKSLLLKVREWEKALKLSLVFHYLPRR
jgi:hypothetical protein